MQYKNESLDEVLKHISKNDWSMLAIPAQAELDKIWGHTGIQQAMMSEQQMRKALGEQSAISGLSTNLSQIAKIYSEDFNSQIEKFDSIQKKLQPWIFAQTKLQDQWRQWDKIKEALSPSLSIIETLASYNSFAKYQKTFKEFGGTLDLENYTEEDIKRTVEENKEIINKVNEVVIAAETKGLPHIDIPELIFAQLQKLLPNINPTSFAILVLILILSFKSYEFYLAYSTEQTIQEKVVPTLEKHSESLDKISTDIQEIKKSTSENKNQFKEIKNEVKSTDDKLDSIIEEMRKINNQKK